MRMRALLRSFPAVFAAVLYVALGISASWHAPHFSQAEAAIHMDRHTGGHETPSVGDCALCASKTAAHDHASAGRPVVSSGAEAPVSLAVSEAPASGFLGAARARAPPSFS